MDVLYLPRADVERVTLPVKSIISALDDTAISPVIHDHAVELGIGTRLPP
jgi:hypothetical protein